MDDLALAYEIATRLWSEERHGPDGVTVLAMALGIYMEAQEGTHRGHMPIVKTMHEHGVALFDQFRLARLRRAGEA